MEFRVHNWTLPDSNWSFIMAADNLYVSLLAEDRLRVKVWTDDLGGGLNEVSLAGRTDIVARLQRDTQAKRYTLEVWNADGTGYAVSTLSINALAQWNANGTWGFPQNGLLAANIDVAYWRWYSTLVELDATPPHGSSGGDLAGWEFEGNGSDSSGHHLDLSMGGGDAVYTSTPTFPPAANAGNLAIVRAGFPAKLNATRSYAFTGDSLTYLWQQLSGPSTVVWSSRTLPAPAVSGLVFGEYTFQVTVKDVAGQSNKATVRLGAVASDDNGRVINTDVNADKMLGPLIRDGRSPWPWFDDRHKTLAGWFGNWLDTDPDFDDDWNRALTGTISVTNGSATVAGSGTQFRTDYCGGGASPQGAPIVIWYPVGGGTYGRRDYDVKSCDSQTQITLARVYDTTSGTSGGLRYSRMGCYGCWVGSSTNVNYYDSVLAYYSLYYRTGLTQYRTWARELADRWWSMPDIDEGRDQWGSHGFHALDPRRKSIAGLIMRALDGRSEMWGGLTVWLDGYAGDLKTQANLIVDLREQGYRVAFVALGARFHPNAGKRASYIDALEQAISKTWGPLQTEAGIWWNPTYGYKSANDHSTLAVVNGSASVTLNGGTWQPSWFWHIPDTTPNAFLAYGTWADLVEDHDAISYIATYVDPTHATLDRPYEGTTSDTKGWQLANLVGEGTQPFMAGVASTGWYWAHKALEEASSEYADEARQFVLDIADWLTARGYRSGTRGLHYGRDFTNCEPIGESNQWCAGESSADSRYLNSEVVNAHSAAYLLTGRAAYKTQGDLLFGAMWGGPNSEGPEADGTYNSEYSDGGWTFATKKAKNFGFAFGFGLGAGWPAARLGTVAPTVDTPLSIAFDLGNVGGATQVRVTLRRPAGGEFQKLCPASPCAVTVDKRQGDHLMRMEYLSSDGRVLAFGEWTPTAVR